MKLLLQVTTLLMEGEGSSHQLRKMGPLERRYQLSDIQRARGTKVTRHDDVYVAFPDIVKSDYFKTLWHWFPWFFLNSYHIRLFQLSDRRPVAKKTFSLTNHNKWFKKPSQQINGLMRNAYLRKPNIVLRFYINKSHYFESLLSLVVLT